MGSGIEVAFFGLHLLKLDKTKRIAIVESKKTAIIAFIVLVGEFLITLK